MNANYISRHCLVTWGKAVKNVWGCRMLGMVRKDSIENFTILSTLLLAGNYIGK